MIYFFLRCKQFLLLIGHYQETSTALHSRQTSALTSDSEEDEDYASEVHTQERAEGGAPAEATQAAVNSSNADYNSASLPPSLPDVFAYINVCVMSLDRSNHVTVHQLPLRQEDRERAEVE